MLPSALERGSACAPDSERPTIAALDRLLQADPQALFFAMTDARPGERVPFTRTVLRLLHELVHQLAQGNVVTIVPAEKQLTTQQAADILNVSRPYLVRLLEEGKVPFTKTGTHRRVRFDDLMRYKQERDAARRSELRELTRMSEEMGMYDLSSDQGER
jgi:excisionase family DNA binding protein